MQESDICEKIWIYLKNPLQNILIALNKYIATMNWAKGIFLLQF